MDGCLWQNTFRLQVCFFEVLWSVLCSSLNHVRIPPKWSNGQTYAPIIMNVGMLIDSGLKSAIFFIFFSLRPKKQVIIVCLPHYFNL